MEGEHEGNWGVFARMPKLTFAADLQWRRRFARAADDLADDLEHGRWPQPTCTAEELALHFALDDARDLQDELDDTDDAARTPLPVHRDDYDFDACTDMFFQDTDVLMLYNARFDGIEDPDGETDQQIGMGDLRVAAWFDPIEPGRPSPSFPNVPLWSLSVDGQQVPCDEEGQEALQEPGLPSRNPLPSASRTSRRPATHRSVPTQAGSERRTSSPPRPSASGRELRDQGGRFFAGRGQLRAKVLQLLAGGHGPLVPLRPRAVPGRAERGQVERRGTLSGASANQLLGGTPRARWNMAVKALGVA